MSNPVIDDALDKIYPVVNGAGSDSAMLDNTLEFLVMSGMDLPLAVMVTIPEPWTKDGSISRAKRDLYQYYAIMMEPWDGPASILFSDGDAMGAVLDRNGLRPSRYYITDDGKLILSSEVGALDLDPRKIVKKSRLEPGKMLLVDTVQGRIIDDAELKETYAARQPYGEWLDRGLIRLKDLPVPNKKVPGYSQEELTRLEKAFGYTYEDVKNNSAVRTYIQRADESLTALGYTEHSFAHVTAVAENAAYILSTLGYPERTVELAKIAGFLHDIGNLVNRVDHSQSGAVMAFRILDNMDCPPEEIATIVTAIGNHDEGTGMPVNAVAAALILADKSDVRRSRVRNPDMASFDIHDRVNYSVKKSVLKINEEHTLIKLKLSVDTKYGSVMDYFEIFMGRMLLCRKAAEKLGLQFKLMINEQQLI